MSNPALSHTPSPWSGRLLDGGRQSNGVRIEHGDTPVAFVYGSDPIHGIVQPAQNANACLIAAAPELMAAAWALVWAANCSPQMDGTTIIHGWDRKRLDAAFQSAREAIAKATGGTTGEAVAQARASKWQVGEPPKDRAIVAIGQVNWKSKEADEFGTTPFTGRIRWHCDADFGGWVDEYTQLAIAREEGDEVVIGGWIDLPGGGA